MNTLHASAQILPFPLHLVRPGIRQLANNARRRILAAQEDGSWAAGESGVTPDFVAGLIPPLKDLFDQTDLEVAETAIKVSILCMHVIHAGEWDDRKELTFFVDLQCAGTRLESHPKIQKQAS